MLKMNDKQVRVLSITLASFGVTFIFSGLIMNAQIKPIINTSYTLTVKSKKIAEQQAKAQEINVKNIEIEINNPLSVDIKDYLENVDKISPDILKNLKIDTSLVNISQKGEYQYTISYGKKKYIGTITVKEKDNKTPPFTVKELIEIPKGASLNVYDVSYYLKDVPTQDILSNIRIDTSEVNLNVCGTYPFYALYQDTKYQGQIKITEQFISPQQQEPEPEKKSCVKEDGIYYDKEGNQVDDLNYHISCKDIKCRPFNHASGTTYFDNEGNQVSLETYQNKCSNN